jgi:hypothetical protein
MVGPPSGEVSKRLQGSWDEVIPLRLAAGVAAWPVIRGARNPFVVASLVIGAPPLLAGIAEFADGQSVSWFIWGIAAVYGLLIAVMIWGAKHAWQQVLKLGGDLDAMLPDVDQRAVADWLSRWLRTWPQLSAMLFGAVLATAVGVKLSGPLRGYADHGGFAYDVTIAWTGGVGAVTAYWLWGAPALFYPLSRVEQPNLDWVVPLQTPAIQKASRLTVTTSRLSTAGLLLFMLPIAGTVFLASGELSVWALSVAPALIAGVTVVASSVVPQIILEDLLRRGRRKTLAEIRRLLPPPTEVFQTAQPAQMQAVELYQAIGNASVSTLDWKRFVEYILLFVSAMIPLAIALANGL